MLPTDNVFHKEKLVQLNDNSSIIIIGTEDKGVYDIRVYYKHQDNLFFLLNQNVTACRGLAEQLFEVRCSGANLLNLQITVENEVSYKETSQETTSGDNV